MGACDEWNGRQALLSLVSSMFILDNDDVARIWGTNSDKNAFKDPVLSQPNLFLNNGLVEDVGT